MKKRYILILSMIFVILSISCVSAVDNDTDVFKEQNNDMISINVTEATMSRWISGKRQPTAYGLYRVAKVFRVDMESLMEGIEND